MTMDKILVCLTDLDSSHGDPGHMENITTRVGKWILRNEQRPQVLPKTISALSRSIKSMCSFSYLDLGMLMETLKFYEEQGVFEVNDDTGALTYKKKAEKKSNSENSSEEEEEEEEEEERGVLSLSDEQKLERDWIIHPHNSPKHITKLVSCVAFRSQKKEESDPLEVVEHLVKEGYLSIPTPHPDTPTSSKITYNFPRWQHTANKDIFDFQSQLTILNKKVADVSFWSIAPGNWGSPSAWGGEDSGWGDSPPSSPLVVSGRGVSSGRSRGVQKGGRGGTGRGRGGRGDERRGREERGTFGDRRVGRGGVVGRGGGRGGGSWEGRGCWEGGRKGGVSRRERW